MDALAVRRRGVDRRRTRADLGFAGEGDGRSRARRRCGSADGLDGIVTAEAESYALRVEYDIPLPIGAGTIPHTVGEIRRTSAGENAKGVAASPTQFDAVVAGTYVNPNSMIKDPKNYNRLPQAECFYPGALVDTKFAFPTDTRDQTKALPPLMYFGPVSVESSRPFSVSLPDTWVLKMPDAA